MNDAELINHLGGPAKVAELLNFDKEKGGVQRVNNWVTRGIPAHVKVEFPSLFIPGFGNGATPQPSPQPAGQGA